jgi:copper chaperone CopZ
VIEVTIAGMSCGNCVRHVREALSQLDGASDVSVDLQAGKAQLAVGTGVRDARIRAVVEEEGYEVKAIRRS